MLPCVTVDRQFVNLKASPGLLVITAGPEDPSLCDVSDRSPLVLRMTSISFSSLFFTKSGEKAFIRSDLLHAMNTETRSFTTKGDDKMWKRNLMVQQECKDNRNQMALVLVQQKPVSSTHPAAPLTYSLSL